MAGYYDRDRNPDGAFKTGATAAGTMSHPSTYIGNTAEYLVSGWPYVKSIINDDGVATTYTLNLNYVTSEIKIQAVGSDMTVSLQDSDSFIVAAGTTMTFPVKCTKLSFSNAVQDHGIIVIAALTNIPAAQFPSDSWVGGSVTES